jgi:putative hydrolase of HD superfamily
MSTRLERQIAFLLEADKLKNVLRRTLLTDASRRENSAEHSWHLVLAAIVLHEYAAEPVDLLRAVELLAVHDLVEIDAGDTFAYDAHASTSKEIREQAAAERIFGLLPPDAAERLRALWAEFEAQASPEARFAHAVDRIQPLLQNVKTGGGTWRIYQPSRAQVLERMEPVRTALPALWPVVLSAVEEFFPQE